MDFPITIDFYWSNLRIFSRPIIHWRSMTLTNSFAQKTILFSTMCKLLRHTFSIFHHILQLIHVKFLLQIWQNFLTSEDPIQSDPLISHLHERTKLQKKLRLRILSTYLGRTKQFRKLILFKHSPPSRTQEIPRYWKLILKSSGKLK